MGKRSDRLWNKREAIEAGHFESWLARGQASFHMENLVFVRKLLDRSFRVFGLYARGERNALDLKVRRVRFGFDDLPAAFDGFRILLLSDLHIDGLRDLPGAIRAAVESVECELCVLAGDYRFEIYGPYHQTREGLACVLGAVRARHGIVGVLGNHDFGEVVPLLESLGVEMLVNAAREIRIDGESLWCAGVDDPHYYRCADLYGAISGVPEGAFKILAAHSPELAAEASRAGIRLYLCGHTHGGQVRLPLLGHLVRNCRCPRERAAGGWRAGAMHGFTSTGAGSSMVPVRFRCPPEIAVIELVRTRPPVRAT